MLYSTASELIIVTGISNLSLLAYNTFPYSNIVLDFMFWIFPQYYIIMYPDDKWNLIVYLITLIDFNKLKLHNLNMTEKELTADILCIFRSYIACQVGICILGVDFDTVFPKRFGKSIDYGYKLMDIGIGSYLYNCGLLINKREYESQKTDIGSKGIKIQEFNTTEKDSNSIDLKEEIKIQEFNTTEKDSNSIDLKEEIKIQELNTTEKGSNSIDLKEEIKIQEFNTTEKGSNSTNLKDKSKTAHTNKYVKMFRKYKSEIILVVLGFLRYFTIIIFNLQVDITEYGKHSNFYFILGILRFLYKCYSCNKTGWSVLIVYQVVTRFFKMDKFVLSDDRTGFLRQNKESFFVIIPFLCSLMIIQHVSRALFSYNCNQKKRVTVFVKYLLINLSKFTLIFYLFYKIFLYFEESSRRLGNCTYIFFILYIHTFHLVIIILVSLLSQFKRHKTLFFVGRNMMLNFLLTNLFVLFFKQCISFTSKNCSFIMLIYLFCTFSIPVYLHNLVTNY